MVLSVVVPSVIKLLLVPLGMSHGSHLIPFAQNDTTEVYNLALDQLNITTTDEVERARECHARLTSSELKKSTPTSVEVEMLNCGQFSDFLTLPVEPVAETQTFADILNNTTVTLTVKNTDKHHTLMKLIELYTEITALNAQ